ncbi:unnamed protein product [Durusdinium trenchii]|uniref:Co-chaperone HscB C-terminal oligomerisation domain-containing protein n=1 Tax=Durusdinium trenchii TaxID=1381693 RepID=A0ABP0N970_9DINO
MVLHAVHGLLPWWKHQGQAFQPSFPATQAAVLRSPLRRAQYWMELNGQKILLEEQRIEDMQTMMEVMETSEELDAAKTQSEVDGLRQRNRSKIESVESELSEIFKHEDWMTARHRVERLQMLTRLQERMDDWRPK